MCEPVALRRADVPTFAEFISAEPNISVCFTDENIGMVICTDPYSDKILRTTDGGANWNFQSSGTNEMLYDVFCTDASNAWIVGSNGTIQAGAGPPVSPSHRMR